MTNANKFAMINIVRADTDDGLPAVVVFANDEGDSFEVLVYKAAKRVRRERSGIPLGHGYRASMPRSRGRTRVIGNPADSTLEAFGTAISETAPNLPYLLQSLLVRDWDLDVLRDDPDPRRNARRDGRLS